MNISILWDNVCHWCMHAGLPIVACYHLVSTDPFINVSASDASGIERVANAFLAPTQYLLAGNMATPIYSEEGEFTRYQFNQRFNYQDPMIWVKTAGAYIALPSSFLIGTALKGVSYLFPETRSRYQKIYKDMIGQPVLSNKEYYERIGINIGNPEEAEKIRCQGYLRRPGEEFNLQVEKKALQEILKVLSAHNIPCWLDCGTCLGAYRYGGVIPWDWDVDLAILQPDFTNVLHALRSLDSEKYMVQDWSSRDVPGTYLKVYVKESDALIDIYHFGVDPANKMIHSIVSNEGSIFLREAWRERERRFKVPTPFEVVFPLKKIDFDGIEAYVPNQVKTYLEMRYGNIDPAKVYNEETGKYEKVPGHPYWIDGELNVNR